MMGRVGTETGKTDQKIGKLGEKFRKNRGITFGLVGMATAGFEAIGMFQMLQDTQTRMAESQQTLNELQEKGITSGREYSNAQSQLTKDQRFYNMTLRNTVLSFTDLIPFTLMTISSLVNMGVGLGSITKKFTVLGGKIKDTPKALKAFTVVAGASNLANPIIAAITAASTAFIALTADVEGTRTKLNEFGEEMGNTHPAVKQLLTVIGDLTNGLLDARNAEVLATLDAIGLKDEYIALTGTTDTLNEAQGTLGSGIVDLSPKFQTLSSTVREESLTIQQAMEKNADITDFSVQEQTQALLNLEKNTKDVTTSVAAWLRAKERSEANHAQLYITFVTALKTYNQAMLESMELTIPEINELYEEWEEEQEEVSLSVMDNNEDVIKSYGFTVEQWKQLTEEQIESLSDWVGEQQDATFTLTQLHNIRQTELSSEEARYQQFVSAMKVGTDDWMARMELIPEEYDSFTERIKQEQEDLLKETERIQDEMSKAFQKAEGDASDAWTKSIDEILSQNSRLSYIGKTAQTSFIEKSIELQNKVFEASLIDKKKDVRQ